MLPRDISTIFQVFSSSLSLIPLQSTLGDFFSGLHQNISFLRYMSAQSVSHSLIQSATVRTTQEINKLLIHAFSLSLCHRHILLSSNKAGYHHSYDCIYLDFA